MIKFSEVKIGQKFVFDFDKSVKDGSYHWSYEKVADNKVKCLIAPKTENNCIGRIESFGSFHSLCHILED